MFVPLHCDVVTSNVVNG